MWEQRLRALLAILLVGDGVFALIAPSRQSRLWKFGPGSWRRLMEYFAQRPGLTRLLTVGQVAFGLWLGLRQAKR
jgi:hypothetical protein